MKVVAKSVKWRWAAVDPKSNKKNHSEKVKKMQVPSSTYFSNVKIQLSYAFSLSRHSIHVQLFLLWAFWQACMTNSSMPNRPHHFWCFVTVFERNNFKASNEKWPKKYDFRHDHQLIEWLLKLRRPELKSNIFSITAWNKSILSLQTPILSGKCWSSNPKYTYYMTETNKWNGLSCYMFATQSFAFNGMDSSHKALLPNGKVIKACRSLYEEWSER